MRMRTMFTIATIPGLWIALHAGPAGAQDTQVAAEVPWTPVDTGTVRPGMTAEEVIGVWGTPVTQRQAGDWMFLFFRNGCEVSCGTYDVVFLQGGQVVDAVVRGRGHRYDGVSSSPPGQAAVFTPPPGNAQGAQ